MSKIVTLHKVPDGRCNVCGEVAHNEIVLYHQSLDSHFAIFWLCDKHLGQLKSELVSIKDDDIEL